MAKKEESSVAGLGEKVVSLQLKCTTEDCKKRPERAGFCGEHFAWFKEGLVTKEGRKPKDFDKKYMSWLQKQKAA